MQEFTKRFNELASSSIDEQIEIEVSVFPNPSAGIITVKSDITIQQIKLYGVDGKLLSAFSTTTFELEKRGTYFLKIITSKGNAIKKVVVN